MASHRAGLLQLYGLRYQLDAAGDIARSQQTA
jgi:hypothetical protein